MTGVRITLCLFTALAGIALGQESIELRGRSIPENSIEMQIVAADLAAEVRSQLGDDLESPWHNQGHMTEARTLRHIIFEGLIEAGVAEDRTVDYEVWNQPLVGLARSSTSGTPDQVLWVVIRVSTEGVTFTQYTSYEEALRGVEKDDIKRGVVVDRYTGAEVWNQSTDRLGVFVVAVAPEGAVRAIGIPCRSVTNMNSAHERQAYDIEADFDGAMLAAEQTDTTVGSDKFQTASPGHKTVGELTLRVNGGAIVIVLVWDKDGNDVDLAIRRGFINSPDFLALLEVGPFSDPTVDPAGLSLPGSFTSFPKGAKPAHAR